MQTRRQFVRAAGTAGAGIILVPKLALAGGAPPLASGGRFSDGVASGDPSPSAITLWTRLDEVSGRRSVELEVAREKDFRKVVARKLIPTSEAINGSVKARVTGLKNHEQYFYRFATSKRDSPVGRFRTALPADSRQPVTFAHFSCQDYTHGYYNAHQLLAREDDLDFIVDLGDYIYAETYHSRKDKTGVRDDKIGKEHPGKSTADTNFERVAVSLDDYRAKYSLYRTDEHLRKVNELFPMVSLWDDHEVQDNYAGKEADGGLPPELAYSRKRRNLAYKAYFESMPYIPPSGGTKTYRSLRFGRTVELFCLDERQHRANQPCDDAVAPPCADWDQPRDFLGRSQMNWIKSALEKSDATWKIVANQVMIMPTKVLGGSFFTYDSWQGYPREREELLTHIRDKKIDDVLFITGDIHTFIAGDVRTNMGDGDTVAIELVSGSITSSGLGELDIPAGGGVVIKGNDANPHTDPGIIDALRGVNPWVDAADFDHHGYGLLKVTGDEADSRFRRLSTIKKKSTKTEPDAAFRYKIKRGQKSIKGVHGPPAS